MGLACIAELKMKGIGPIIGADFSPKRRALAVRKQLVLLGASAAQIKTVSYGEERPAVDGHEESAYRMNRRVELVY